MDWLEVSLVVSGELAEAVAEVLARYAPNGVATEQAAATDLTDPEGRADGPITVRAYLPVDDRLDEMREGIEESLGYLGMIRPIPAPAFRLLADQNWMEAWKRHYTPISVGRRLIIVPAWMETQESDRIAVKINPGMAFGTGTHPSTQLCLELVESHLGRGRGPGQSEVTHTPGPFIDIGCGSGILCFAALKLGAQCALGVDTDAEALINARENAIANGIGSELHLVRGSVAEIRRGAFPWTRGQLVAANILAPVIISLLDAGLAQLVEEGGMIVLGGILEHQASDVLAAAQSRGLRLREQRQLGEWVALAMQRPQAAPAADLSDTAL
ncbi:MAG: 50S ribosomal protein L11 methyltransferase [Anaerolineales bacterium]|jgi:ribosomal protein L11 methyltransferase